MFCSPLTVREHKLLAIARVDFYCSSCCIFVPIQKIYSNNRMMSTNYDQNSSASTLYTIRLYCVRLKDIIKDDFKFKADFGNNTMLTFDEEPLLRSQDDLTPFIYMLQLNGKIDDSKRLQIRTKDGFKFIESYRLIISRPRPVTVYPKIHHQEKIDQNHELPENFENPSNYFHFDTQFSKGMMFEPPGKNIVKEYTSKNILLL